MDGYNENFETSPAIYGMQSANHPVEYLQHIDPSIFLDELEHFLRGERLNNNGEWEQIEGIPRLNRLGVSRVMNIVRVAVNKVVFLSNLNRKEIGMICENLHVALLEDFFYHHIEYQLKLSSAESIIDMIMTPIFAGLLRAEGEGDRSLFRETTTISGHMNLDDGNQGKSWIPDIRRK